MPGIVLMDAGLRGFLEDTKSRRNTYQIALYVNNRTPLRTDSLSNYVEASFPGYNRQSVPSWGTAATNASGEAESIHPVLNWTTTGPLAGQMVYGYLWIDNVGALVAAELRAAGPVDMSTTGATFGLVPRITERNRP